MSRSKSYLFAFLLGLLTVIVCLAIGDGLIGVAGTLGDCVYDESGELIEYAVHVRDATGRNHLLERTSALSRDSGVLDPSETYLDQHPAVCTVLVCAFCYFRFSRQSLFSCTSCKRVYQFF